MLTKSRAPGLSFKLSTQKQMYYTMATDGQTPNARARRVQTPLRDGMLLDGGERERASNGFSHGRAAVEAT